MLIYGGLIQSRSSMDSVDTVLTRFNQTLGVWASRYPKKQISVSAVIMRIPSYDGDFEEPWYWAESARVAFLRTRAFFPRFSPFSSAHRPQTHCTVSRYCFRFGESKLSILPPGVRLRMPGFR